MVLKLVFARVYFLVELLSICSLKWSLAINHFEENYANGPDVGLVRILVLHRHLWGHVQRSTANCLVYFLLVPEFLGETKVGNLDLKCSPF